METSTNGLSMLCALVEIMVGIGESLGMPKSMLFVFWYASDDLLSMVLLLLLKALFDAEHLFVERFNSDWLVLLSDKEGE